MKNIFKSILVILLVVVCASCTNKKAEPLDAKYLHDWNIALESGIINDFFSPPVAGRMYTYPNLIVYTVLTDGKNDIQKNLINFPELPKIHNENRALVAMFCFYNVGKKMVYSFNFLDEHLPEFEKQIKTAGISENEIEIAKTKAEEISSVFLEWVAKDGYKESRSDTKFTLSKKPGAWKPTPPDFMDALEPNWNKIRPFFIDSASQFTANYEPYPYNMTDKNSNFYKELMEVKVQVDKTNENELATSKYWDCNPLAPQHKSHATYAEKKLTPGGHWLSIGRNISIQEKDNLEQAAKMYALVSLSINDGFISCWDSKYHYDYIRPVTAIQENWDTEWMTLILTPNFPEYPSGHSVVSGVASTVLAAIYGNEVAFTDNAEEPFGMEPRSFNSISEACDQAAMSRFWAGIHYKKAILDGVTMGREIGNTIIEKTNMKNAK
jgi:hypothetical protein